MDDLDLECSNCRGHGAYSSGRACESCDGTGQRRCSSCAKRPAALVVDGSTYLCGRCYASSCAFCVTGTPVAQSNGRPCCEGCLAEFAGWQLEETGT